MLSEQHDLLTWQAPNKIALFPLTRRLHKIRHTATKLAERKTEEDALLYLRQVRASLFKQLERAEVTGDEAEARVEEFLRAVVHHLERAGLSSAHDTGDLRP